ncbi:MAG: hypothetical protein ABI601_13435, partial [bacterium]
MFNLPSVSSSLRQALAELRASESKLDIELAKVRKAIEALLPFADEDDPPVFALKAEEVDAAVGEPERTPDFLGIVAGADRIMREAGRPM